MYIHTSTYGIYKHQMKSISTSTGHSRETCPQTAHKIISTSSNNSIPSVALVTGDGGWHSVETGTRCLYVPSCRPASCDGTVSSESSVGVIAMPAIGLCGSALAIRSVTRRHVMQGTGPLELFCCCRTLGEQQNSKLRFSCRFYAVFLAKESPYHRVAPFPLRMIRLCLGSAFAKLVVTGFSPHR